MTVVRYTEHCRGSLWRREWPVSEAWLVHHHCFLSCIQNKDGFLTSEKDFKTLILLFGDGTAAHPEVYNALPHSLLLQCSVQCICRQGETGSVILKYNRRKYFLQSSATDKKSTQTGFFRKEGEHSRGCCCID